MEKEVRIAEARMREEGQLEAQKRRFQEKEALAEQQRLAFEHKRQMQLEQAAIAGQEKSL